MNLKEASQKLTTSKLIRSLHVRTGALNTVHLTLNLHKRWTTTAQVQIEANTVELYDSEFGETETVCLSAEVTEVLTYGNFSRLPYVLHDKDQICVLYIPFELVVKEEKKFAKLMNIRKGQNA